MDEDEMLARMRAAPVEFLLGQLATVLRRHHEQLAGVVGLREVELACVEIADRPRGIPMTALAERLGRSPAATTAIVDRLVESGWVARWRDPLNERRVRVAAVTAPGETGRVRAVTEELVRAQDGFDDAELAVVARWLALQTERLSRRATRLADERSARREHERRHAELRRHGS